MKGRLTTAAMVALAGFAASAMEISAWRGESLFVTFEHVNGGESSAPYRPAFEGLPAGFGGRIGIARPVKFEREPNSGEFIVANDRIEWNAEEPYLAPGRGRQVVFELKVPADARPGWYLFRAGDEPVNLRVVNRTLPPPREWKYYLDLWQHPWAVARWDNVKPFSKEHYAAMRPLWETLASAGQKVVTTTITKLPWNHQCFDGYDTMVRHIKTKDGWKFDYSLFDEYVAFCLDCGLGPDISCYTMCPWKYYVYGEDEKGEEIKVLAKPGSKEFEDYWKPFLIDFKRHLIEKGWFERTAISMDERAPEDMRIISKFIKEFSGLKIATAGNFDPTKHPEIDMYSYAPVIDTVTDEFLANNAARIADPKRITTYYVCCVPYRPNTFLESKLEESFWCGFFPAAKGLGGFLRWAYNSWPSDPRHDASFGNWRAGDTFLVYPDNGISPRFLELRNGIQAAEKFRILKEAGEDLDALKTLAAKYDFWKARKLDADLKPIKEETMFVLNRDPGERILFNGRDLANFYTYVAGRGVDKDPKGVFTVRDGVLHVTGEEYGGVCTKEEFENYIFRCEFRFTGEAHMEKALNDEAPDSGILFHSYGKDGACGPGGGCWMYSHEYNLVKGCSGDFWSVGPEGDENVYLEVETHPVMWSDTPTYKSYFWKKGGRRVRMTGNQQCCRFDKSRDYVNRSFAPLAVNENPVGEWNSAQVVLDGGKVRCYANGKLVNEAVDVQPRKGKIQLQSEGCGIEFRHITVAPLNGID